MGEKAEKLSKLKVFSGSTLKYIAIITMLIDHIGAILVAPMIYQSESSYKLYWVLRDIGRIAFPIFCFFLVEGFVYTRDVKKYAKRLFLFALLSEIPFDIGFHEKWFYMGGQNVFFTLLIGLMTIAGLRCVNESVENGTKQIAARLFVAAAGCMAAILLKTDYHMYGVISILVLYLYRDEKNRLRQLFMGAMTFLWEPFALLAFPLLLLYNGKRGRQPKYLFYAFYPVHILILYAMSRLM